MREEVRKFLVWGLIYVISVFLVAYAFSSFEKFYRKNINKNDCEFVCNHLVKKSKHYWYGYDVFSILRKKYGHVLNLKKVYYPYTIVVDKPLYCPCGFRVWDCNETLNNTCEVKTIVYLIDYRNWRDWYENW